MITKKVKLIKKEEFIAIILNFNYKFFVVDIVAFNINFDLGAIVYPLKRAQIAHLKVDKAPIKVFIKYTNFMDIFLPKLTAKLFKYTEINNCIINLMNN